MIKFAPYRILISGNDRDDLLYELYQYEREVKRIADEKFGTSKTHYESSYPDPKGNSIEYYNKLERKESIGPRAEKFEQGVQEALKEISRWKSGICLLEATNYLPDDLYILPFGARDRVMMPGSEYTQCDADLNSISATNKEKVPPIKFAFNDDKVCKREPIFMPETTIFHELVHAVRPNKTKLLHIKADDKWDNLEEFFAVLAENIFRSERKQNNLLRGGHDSRIMSHDRSTSEGFLKDKKLKIWAETVFKEEKLAQKLAHVSFVEFNPFAVIGRTVKH